MSILISSALLKLVLRIGCFFFLAFPLIFYALLSTCPAHYTFLYFIILRVYILEEETKLFQRFSILAINENKILKIIELHPWSEFKQQGGEIDEELGIYKISLEFIEVPRHEFIWVSEV
jgi:hypothetical protein